MPAAQAGLSVSTPPARSEGGFLRVVSPDQLDAQDRASAQVRVAASKPLETQDLGAFIRQRWTVFRNHRNTGNNPLNQRLLRAQRMFEGKYDPDKLQQIQRFGGSEVYARIVAGKCRGATALLRDVYLGADKPWDVESEPDPPIPPGVIQSIEQLIAVEAQTLQMAGAPVLEDQIHMRRVGLLHAAQAAAQRNANMQAQAASDKIEDILVAGGFYSALAEFLTDMPLFPYACIKGPMVRMVPKLVWSQGKPSLQNVPQMCWERIDPFDFYWTPGASRIAEAEIIERKSLSRADLNDLIGLPGYDEAAVRGALIDYAPGLRDWLDAPDTEQALAEGRENPTTNQSLYIDALEYHGHIQGSVLLDEGVDPNWYRTRSATMASRAGWSVATQSRPRSIPHPDNGIRIMSPVMRRCPVRSRGTVSRTYLRTFKKSPTRSTCAGKQYVDQSGPQVVVNTSCLADRERRFALSVETLESSGTRSAEPANPLPFFSPHNLQELMSIYHPMTSLADDISAIPRYLTGPSV